MCYISAWAAEFKTSKGRLGLVNVPYHPPPLLGGGQFRFVLDLGPFYQKIALCQLTLR